MTDASARERVSLDNVLGKILVCPRDHKELIREGETLRCREGHAYPVVDGIPVLLVKEAKPTLFEYESVLQQIKNHSEGREATGSFTGNDAVDPFVQKSVVGSCGLMYLSLLGKLPCYPIPDFCLPEGNGELLLDIGCGWGRWSISAARKGYEPIGMDPSLEAIMAARRISRQLGITAHFLVADSRFLPFESGFFRNVFSYGVFQHLEETDVEASLKEISRVMKPSGRSLIQMANTYGPSCLLLQAGRGFRKARNFEVHYWTPARLQSGFSRILGPSRMMVDGYFSLNSQSSDIDLLPAGYRLLVSASEGLKKLSRRFTGLLVLADSLYIESSPSGMPPRPGSR